MPDPISRAAQDAAGSAATALEGAAWNALRLRDAVEGARLEAERSGFPGVNDGGPGDAYRHLLITGEMKRRFGPPFAYLFAAGHDFVNDLTGSQSERDNEMDNLNNSVAANGPDFQTWEDVVRWARGKIMEAAPHNGDGEDGRAFWYRKQPREWRPDFTDVPITPIEMGAPEHRYTPSVTPDNLMTEPMAMADAARPAAAPLDRPVASWTEADVRTVLRSPAYLQPKHPRHIEAQARCAPGSRSASPDRFRSTPPDAASRIATRRLPPASASFPSAPCAQGGQAVGRRSLPRPAGGVTLRP